MKKTFLLVLIFIFSLFLFACKPDPVCGNGILEEGETFFSCCNDAGCSYNEQTCEQNNCKDPICTGCYYLKDHKCVKYECCDHSDCLTNQKCQGHECKKIECSNNCEYIKDRRCIKYTCCLDSQCDDNNKYTQDTCQFAKTQDSRCYYEELDRCKKDRDCDDNDKSTKDTCFGRVKKCYNEKITKCLDDDNYCPNNCYYKTDNDCKRTVKDCGENMDCFIQVAEKCDLSKYKNKIAFDFFGVFLQSSSDMKIHEFYDDGTCLFKTIITEVNSYYTNEMKQEMRDKGMSEEEINQAEKDMQNEPNDTIGTGQQCRVTGTHLAKVLRQWKEGTYSSSDFDGYACTMIE